jgi:hypothetical protein
MVSHIEFEFELGAMCFSYAVSAALEGQHICIASLVHEEASTQSSWAVGLSDSRGSVSEHALCCAESVPSSIC